MAGGSVGEFPSQGSLSLSEADMTTLAWGRRFILRACVVNVRTEASDIPNLLDAVVEISRTFHAGAGSVPEQARG